MPERLEVTAKGPLTNKTHILLAEGKMQLFVRTTVGRTVVLDAEPDFLVRRLAYL